jgi:hypothetical protein
MIVTSVSHEEILYIQIKSLKKEIKTLEKRLETLQQGKHSMNPEQIKQPEQTNNETKRKFTKTEIRSLVRDAFGAEAGIDSKYVMGYHTTTDAEENERVWRRAAVSLSVRLPAFFATNATLDSMFSAFLSILDKEGRVKHPWRPASIGLFGMDLSTYEGVVYVQIENNEYEILMEKGVAQKVDKIGS